MGHSLTAMAETVSNGSLVELVDFSSVWSMEICVQDKHRLDKSGKRTDLKSTRFMGYLCMEDAEDYCERWHSNMGLIPHRFFLDPLSINGSQ